jgi:catalase
MSNGIQGKVATIIGTLTAPRNTFLALLLIACIVGVLVGAFAYTAGWFSPGRLTPNRLVASLAPPDGAALGHRRNHAKGICFTGTFATDGAGTALSSASIFATGTYPVIGRFNIGSPDLRRDGVFGSMLFRQP